MTRPSGVLQSPLTPKSPRVAVSVCADVSGVHSADRVLSSDITDPNRYSDNPANDSSFLVPKNDLPILIIVGQSDNHFKLVRLFGFPSTVTEPTRPVTPSGIMSSPPSSPLLLDLPLELLFRIFSRLPLSSLYRLGATCRRLHSLVHRNDRLWRLVSQKFIGLDYWY